VRSVRMDNIQMITLTFTWRRPKLTRPRKMIANPFIKTAESSVINVFTENYHLLTPVTSPLGLFVTSIEHGRYNHETRRYSTYVTRRQLDVFKI
jgi:hypothetical protein